MGYNHIQLNVLTAYREDYLRKLLSDRLHVQDFTYVI